MSKSAVDHYVVMIKSCTDSIWRPFERKGVETLTRLEFPGAEGGREAANAAFNSSHREGVCGAELQEYVEHEGYRVLGHWDSTPDS